MLRPLPFIPLELAISHHRFPDTPPDIPRAEKLSELCNPPVMRASITYHIQPSGCGVHQLPLPSTRSPSLPPPLSDASISSNLQLDTFPEGLYYAYSLERMLCKSELENRFLIAARKKSAILHRRIFIWQNVLRTCCMYDQTNRVEIALFYYDPHITKERKRVLKNIKLPSDFSNHERSMKDFHASWQTCPLQSELRIIIRFYQLLTIYNNLHDAKKRKHNEESRPVIYFIWVYFTLCMYIYIQLLLLLRFLLLCPNFV